MRARLLPTFLCRQEPAFPALAWLRLDLCFVLASGRVSVKTQVSIWRPWTGCARPTDPQGWVPGFSDSGI